MRVNKSGQRRDGLRTIRKRRSPAAPSSRAFLEVLQSEHNVQIDLEVAMAQIDEYARRLRESPVYENLRRYKEGVRTVLRLLVKKSYTVTEQSFYDHQGRRRLYMLVESIDQKLEELTRSFLDEQMDSLELVQRLDEIRGMLLDLYT